MIVRDEERRLADCLESVRGLASELVIVDTGSVDRTKQIACRHGARVIEAPWHDDFAAARNVGLAEAGGRWILVLDADESLHDQSRRELEKLIERPPVEAFRLVIRSPDAFGLDDVRTEMVRLFPNHPAVRFEQAIHEHVNGALRRAGIPIRDTAIEIDHCGYAEREELLRKQQRNTNIIEEAFRRNPDGDPHLRYYFASTLFDQREWIHAARHYEECAVITRESRTQLSAAAQIGAAQCHLYSGDSERALHHLPASPDPSHHPLALALRASIEQQRGNREEARRWFEAILGVPDITFVPPISVRSFKLKALSALADHWASQGRKNLGVQILQLALDVQKREVGRCESEILLRYAMIIGVSIPHSAGSRVASYAATH